ncbi:hypothetical protein RW25_15810 [Bacillus sp. L_1B0_8]|uniref:hypothetical protein n=1 Tax=unclassified Bacillus (in: firmicutes) TaxID=185979 RepID=UPI0005B6CEC0|nr:MULTISPECIES: hypothetical protein [unclassified Bacillus (in: firmicutes)]KIQ87413.1 hypothetical protein RW25_15810 [Bacillus sp. L_1B0_8]KIQ89384.1 hypothetical protein RT27_07325 [Bacillus sp. L_1B0_5]
MENSYLVKVSGGGLTLEEIADSYLELIESDFNMTIDEIAVYLSCSYDYVQAKIAPYIHHIYINSVANKALFTHDTKGVNTHLFTKRKLFSRSGFQQFLFNESVLLIDRERYYVNELSLAAREKLNEIAKNSKNKTTISEAFETVAVQQAKKTYSKSVLESKDVKKIEISNFPTKLYSVKDLLDGIEELNMKFQYKVVVYRYLKKQGIPKVKLHSLVRYRQEDLRKVADCSFPLAIEKEKLLSSLENILQ